MTHDTAIAEASAAGPLDSAESARAAGLRYTSDRLPGIRRLRTGRGFRYVDPNGRPVRDQATLERIRALAIPPAWREVWISPSPRGHIQATARDARGRKQYRYHARWRAVRDAAKYDRTLAFGQALPDIRARLDRDLRLAGLPRERVVATVVRLLEATLIRVGNEEYARQNRSFGLTTLRQRHARVHGGEVTFQFRGKSGKQHAVGLRDRRLARIVRRCQELPGQPLFQYLDDAAEPRTVSSEDVNTYLREAAAEEFSAKDFRTWAGTVLAARLLAAEPAPGTAAEADQAIVRAVDEVARRLGNTRAVCHRCYIHPLILDAYREDALAAELGALAARAQDEEALEAAVIRLLRGQQAGERVASA